MELVRSRFVVKEDMNPGADKPPARRGYDCAHLVVTGELQDRSRDWLVAGGHLARYFDRFGVSRSRFAQLLRTPGLSSSTPEI